jgi:hypothetical protein
MTDKPDGKTRSNAESAVAAAIDADVAAGNHWWPSEEMASIAFRRWSSFARRHKKKPTFEDRLQDLEKGLSHYDPGGLHAEPGDWPRLTRLLASILAENDA